MSSPNCFSAPPPPSPSPGKLWQDTNGRFERKGETEVILKIHRVCLEQEWNWGTRPTFIPGSVLFASLVVKAKEANGREPRIKVCTRLWYLWVSIAHTSHDYDPLSRPFIRGGTKNTRNWALWETRIILLIKGSHEVVLPGQTLWVEWISSSMMCQNQDLSEIQRTPAQHLMWRFVKENDNLLDK